MTAKDNTSKARWVQWSGGIAVVVVVGLLGIVWANVATEADIAEFVTAPEVKVLVNDYSPYNPDKKSLFLEMERIKESNTRIESKLDKLVDQSLGE
jgi:cytoskeletal protein RodZ